MYNVNYASDCLSSENKSKKNIKITKTKCFELLYNKTGNEKI